MGSMYSNKNANIVITAGAIVVGIALIVLIRQQVGVSDRQFLQSMIPHHSAAILMCTKAPITDSAVRQLCATIVAGQRAEIDQMKHKLHMVDSR
jgi:uncharacterized protein (DUF305 family)